MQAAELELQQAFQLTIGIMTANIISDRLITIASKLEVARKRGCAPFGSTRHQMRWHAPLPEQEVAAVEEEHGVRLPEQYRAFITSLGNGGAGPAYGLLPLSEALKRARLCAPDRFLATPFPHRSAYFPVELTDEDSDMSDAQYYKMQALQAAGTLLMSEQGCGYEDVMVISGPERGMMWLDARVSNQGLHPLGKDFLDWYESWLDDTLAEAVQA